jgi:UDP-N-acetylmuramoyl-tripeptide--D-alanyl-D-alanine ligase
VLTLKQLADKIGAEYIGGDICLQGAAFNSQLVEKGMLFVAIVAERDGHKYIDDAIKKGASAILVSVKQKVDVPQILVTDTRKALGNLAKVWREQFSIPVVTITGSCGKTTTKDILGSMLSQKALTVVTEGNFNNDLGVPLMLLKICEDTKYVVIEVGTNSPGEIEYLAKMVQPTHALITNVSAQHLEGLKCIEGVLEEKAQLFKALSAKGVAIVNMDDARVLEQSRNYDCQKQYYSMSNVDANVQFIAQSDLDHDITNITFKHEHTHYQFETSLFGYHNIQNILAAVTCAFVLEVLQEDIQRGLDQVEITKGRFERLYLSEKVLLVNDSYNASVSSVQAAIKTLNTFEGKRIFVMSNMGELGEYEKYYHTALGQWIAQSKIDKTYLYGDNDLLEETLAVCQSRAVLCKDKTFIMADILSRINLEEPTIILVKGSRANQMEEVVDGLINRRH